MFTMSSGSSKDNVNTEPAAGDTGAVAGANEAKSAAQLKKEAKQKAKEEKMKKFNEKKQKQDAMKESSEGKEKKKKEKKDVAVTTYDVKTPSGEKKDTTCQLPDAYSPVYVEAAWYEWWEKMGFFKPEYGRDSLENVDPNDIFMICIPPPNVTGSLHLGHALTNAIEDALTRWNRMKGKVALWNPGCDHAGIATQVVVEKRLWREKRLTRHDIGREKFLEEAWKWKNEKGGRIYDQLRKIGSSCDWDRECFTMDPKLSRAVSEAFVRMHADGTIYRSNRLINWSCTLKSAISDIEVEKRELPGRTLLFVPGYEEKIEFGVLIEFAYKVENSDEEIVVATTRIETMLGDTAVAVHPEDQRYKQLQGKNVIHPFRNEPIPIIADDFVDMNFGTGAVKITPAHDPNDYDCGKRNNLPFLQMIDDEGYITDVGKQFKGMKRFLARTAVLEALKEKNLYRGTKDNPMLIPICSRSKDIVEPLVKSQWFVDCTEMAAAAVQAVEDGDLEIIPDMHIKTWNQWLKNSRDWCLSRQLWWGHRIPAYFVTIDNDDASGKNTDAEYWVSAHSEEEAKHKAAKRFDVQASNITLTQDEDVLDTWFSSGLFPFAVHGWPEKTPDLSHYYPYTLLETGYDILFFWVARMVMLGQRLTGQVPFKQVYLHSMVRDAHGRKMSKSLGNVIDPIDVIEGISLNALQDRLRSGNLKHDDTELSVALKGQRADFPNGIPECGTDALRFALCTYKAQGDDINLNVQQVLEYRHFCNKIWNAVKFSFMVFGDDFKHMKMEDIMQNGRAIDRWILSKLSHTAEICNSGFHGYNLTVVTTALHHFWLQCLCDVYLETIKPFINDDKSTAAKVSRSVLFTCIDAGLRLLSPFMPYLTEELYQRLPGLTDVSSICVSRYPTITELPYKDVPLEEDTDLMLGVARSIRSLKVQYEVKQVNAFVVCRTDDTHSMLRNYQEDLQTLTKAASLDVLFDVATPSGCAVSTVSPSCDVAVQLKGVVDITNITKKLQMKEIKLNSQLDKLIKATEIKHYNEKVPDEIRQQNSEKVQKLVLELENIKRMLETLLNTKS
ncbi:valine--tRNA ligase-like [Anneissia japonica]|uniref:valine--tRNA ligase-like n=1 Tax=Anneissia japonica TaxID=1529436 RepID=UPI0014254D23|nr:valine--tRNA ligase-like [Anneissia japonica]